MLQLWRERIPLYKGCSSEGSQGKYHQVTPHKKPHTRESLAKTQEGDWLWSGEKQQRIEQKVGFIQGVLETEISRVRIGEVSRKAQTLVGFWDQRLVALGEFSNLEVGSDLLPYSQCPVFLSKDHSFPLVTSYFQSILCLREFSPSPSHGFLYPYTDLSWTLWDCIRVALTVAQNSTLGIQQWDL